MFGFPLDIWNYLTFLTFFILAVASLFLIAFIGGVPGRIAIARKHPDAEAVQLMGWFGLLPVVPWLQAFAWAFKPTNVVDIRRFPIGAQGSAAIYVREGGFAALRRIVIRANSWLNWLYPLAQ